MARAEPGMDDAVWRSSNSPAGAPSRNAHLARFCSSVLFVTGLATVSQAAADDGPLAQAVREGSAKLDLRYRYEYVDQADFDKQARASLLRTRVTLASGEVGAFSGLLEIDNVANIGADDYNSCLLYTSPSPRDHG